MKYEVQFIKGVNGEKDNYRVTHIPSDSRVATCYDESNAKLVCDAMNETNAEPNTPEWIKTKTRLVLDRIEAELLRAKTLFPAKFVNQHEAYAVIKEELDELWDEIKKNQKNYDYEAQRKEATQLAAMVTRLLVELL